MSKNNTSNLLSQKWSEKQKKKRLNSIVRKKKYKREGKFYFNHLKRSKQLLQLSLTKKKKKNGFQIRSQTSN